MNLLRNSPLILLIFLALAFLFPGPAIALKPFIITVLVISMTLSLQEADIDLKGKKKYYFTVKLMALNFVLLSGLLILSSLLVSSPDFRAGLIVLAAVPPAIAVITTAFLLKADVKQGLLAQAACYVFSLLFTPLIIWLFFRNQVNILELLKILVLLIIVPFILSRGVVWLKKKLSIRHDFKELANLAFGLTFYMAIALAVDKIIASPNSVLYLVLISVLSSFGLGSLLIFIGRKAGLRKGEFTLCSLFGTLKNGSFALGICVSLFAPASFVPIAVMSVVHVFYIIFLLWFLRRL